MKRHLLFAPLLILLPSLLPAQITGLEPVSRAVEAGGNVYGLTPQGTGAWTASSNASWIVLNSATGSPPTLAGSGSTLILYTVNDNPSADTRSGAISVAGFTHTITQSGRAATVTATSPATYAAAGGSGTIGVAVSAGTTWTAVSNDAWITVTGGATGTSSGSAAYAVQPYAGVVTRTGSIRIAGQTFAITQTGVDVSLTPTSASRDAASGVVQVQVSSLATTSWVVTPNASWISVVSGGSGSGDATVTLAVGSNPSYLTRTGTVQVGSAVFTVTQGGNPNPVVAISPLTASADPAGGAGSLAVSATPDAPWSVQSTVPWLILSSGATGSGNGNVGYVATPNPTSSLRSGRILVTPPAPPLPSLNRSGGLAYWFEFTPISRVGSATLSGTFPSYNGTSSSSISRNDLVRDSDEWTMIIDILLNDATTIQRVFEYVEGSRRLNVWTSTSGKLSINFNGETIEFSNAVFQTGVKGRLYLSYGESKFQVHAALDITQPAPIELLSRSNAANVFPAVADLTLAKFGGGSLPSPGFMSGRIDLVAFWSRALTNTEREASFLSTPLSTPPASEVGSTVRVGSATFAISKFAGDWFSAKNRARSWGDGWSLARIYNPAEHTAITGLIGNGGVGRYAWFGASRWTVPSATSVSYAGIARGSISWPDGAPVSGYSNWQPGEPNSLNEQAAVLDFNWAGRWFDVAYSGTYVFIAENRADSIARYLIESNSSAGGTPQPQDLTGAKAIRFFGFSGNGASFTDGAISDPLSLWVLDRNTRGLYRAARDRFGRKTQAHANTATDYFSLSDGFSGGFKSISGWVCYDAVTLSGITQQGLCAIDSGAGLMTIGCAPGGKIKVSLGGSVESASVLQAGIWHQIVVTRDASGVLRVYVDGAEVMSIANFATAFATAATNPFSSFAFHGFAGKLDDIAYYAEQLTSAQVAQLYAQQKVGTLTLTVTQDAFPSAFVPGEAATSANSGTVNLSLQAAESVSWTASIPSGTTWARIVSGGTGNGAGTIGVQVDANPSVYPRSFTVTAAAATATVTQQGRAVTVSPLSVVLGVSGTGVPVNINAEAGATWNASSDVTWASLTTTSGAGPGTTTVVAGTYSSTSPSRTGTMQVAGRTVYVTQRGYTLSVSPTAATLPGNNGQGSVAIAAGATAIWEALATVPWITLTSAATGNGPTTLTYSLAENTTGATRTGQILIAGEVVTVNQAAGSPPTITAQPVGVTVSAGQTATFSVTATSTSALTYRWRKGGAPLANGGTVSGATSSLLTLTGVTSADAGAYSVEVTDGSLLTTTSVDAVLVVNAATAQTISFAALAGRTFGDSPVTLAATSSSGLPVAFAVKSGPGSLSGSTLTLTGAGTVVITASQPGNGTYVAATPVDQSLVVSKAAPVVTWNPPASVPVGTVLGSDQLNASATPSGGSFVYAPAAGTALTTVGVQVISATYTPAAADTANYATVTVTRSLNVAAGDLAPFFIRQATSQAIAIGDPVSLTVEVGGSPTPTLQWYRNGGPISNGGRVSGATSTTLTVTPSEAPDAGTYSVVATNRVTSTTSAGATITIVPAGLSAAHSVSGPGYKAGTTVTINGTINYSGTATSLGWQVLLPAGWSYEGGSGSEGDIRPIVGQTDALEWAWSAPPVSPVSFSYTLRVPSAESGDRSIAGLAIVRLTGSSSFFQLLAKPDPLSVRQVRNHSADSDANFRIGLLELTRVIELYNTRAGTSRTGCYVVQPGSEDGFAPDPGRATTVVVTLPAYHSADYDRNGRLGLIELTRVIELYNTRSGTSRTGEYSVKEGTEDGFTPGSGISTIPGQTPAP